MLGKRKEKFIRDMVLLGSGLAADMIDLLEKWLDAKAHLDEKIHREGTDRIVEAVERIARPYREAMERGEVDRVAAIVVEAMKADGMGWGEPIESDRQSNEPVDPEPVESESVDKSTIHPWIKDFGDPETGLGRLIIERTGPTDTHIALVAYLPDKMASDPHFFRRGTVSDCRDAWPTAVKWMEKRFPDPPSDEPVDPEPLYPESYKLFGTPETGHGRLILEPDGGDDRFTLTAYLPEGMDTSSHLFLRGTRAECETAWPEACEWMAERFPENKA